ncbi:hypothetical protein FA821_13385 [Salmonella enterica]|nr:hypothetical protein [Salmonella enterica]
MKSLLSALWYTACFIFLLYTIYNRFPVTQPFIAIPICYAIDLIVSFWHFAGTLAGMITIYFICQSFKSAK